MSLGEKLLALRKIEGLSQEDVAERLEVTRQTVSKWETNQTVPELSKAKTISRLYNVSSEYLLDDNGKQFDPANPIDCGARIGEADWTNAWSKKYPILASYSQLDGMSEYDKKISELYDKMKDAFDFSDLDTFLVLKDIACQKYLAASKTK